MFNLRTFRVGVIAVLAVLGAGSAVQAGVAEPDQVNAVDAGGGVFALPTWLEVRDAGTAELIRLAQISIGGGGFGNFQFGGGGKFRRRGGRRRINRHRGHRRGRIKRFRRDRFGRSRTRNRRHIERRRIRRERRRELRRGHKRLQTRERRIRRARERTRVRRLKRAHNARERLNSRRRRAVTKRRREHLLERFRARRRAASRRRLVRERRHALRRLERVRRLRRERLRHRHHRRLARFDRLRKRLKRGHRHHRLHRLRRLRLAELRRKWWRRRCGHGGHSITDPGRGPTDEVYRRTRGHGGRSVGGHGRGRLPFRPGHRCGWRIPKLPGFGILVLLPPSFVPVPDDDGPRDGRRPPGAQGAPPRAQNRAPATLPDQRFWPRQVVVRLDRFLPRSTDLAIGQAHNLVLVSSETNALIGQQILLYRIPDQRGVAAVVAELGADPRVEAVQPNWRFEATQGATGTAAPGLQYALDKIRLKGAHALAKGAGVRIAVIDSGIDTKHPDLKGSVVRGFDATRGEGERDDTHGTAIAGIVRGRGVLRGIAPEARLLAARAFFRMAGFDGELSSTIIVMRALDWSVANGAQVVNMSFAGPQDDGLAKAVENAAKKGVIMVAAAGNDGPKAKPAYPAAYTDVIAVTATDADDRLYEKANRGTYLTAAAPGVDVYVAAPHNGHRFSTGTSMAAAHVTGLIALMLELNRDLKLEVVRDAIMRSARDLGARGIDVQFGAGRVDAEALLHAMPMPTRLPVPIADRDR